MEKKRILLVDDDELITMSLEMIISSEPEFEIVGKGKSGREAVRLYNELTPDLLLMDIRMNDMNGLEAAEEILRAHKDAVILFLTTFSDDEYIVKALKLGVKGYLLKQDYKSLPTALNAAINGQSVFGGAIIDKLPSLMNKDTDKPSVSNDSLNYESYGITEKEYEVIQLVAEGFSNKEIAQKLFLSEGTVRNYLSTILEKLGLRDRTQLAIFYLKNQE
ncbi:MAG: response regulator transcription factor [Lachnospiraceae bacterium]|nr:response regulator transcription factor [Lachnospiraceae bacterium]